MMRGKVVQQNCPTFIPSLLSSLSPTRKRCIIYKKHKLRYEPKNFNLSWPKRPKRPHTMQPAYLHSLIQQAWTASSSAKQPPEHPKSSPRLPPKEGGRAQDRQTVLVTQGVVFCAQHTVLIYIYTYTHCGYCPFCN